MLEIEDLSVRYGEVLALAEVSLVVRPGEVVAIMGPNAAGKSTLARALGGLVACCHGEVRLDGAALLSIPPARRPAAGLVVIPEGRGIIGSLSVYDNLCLGTYARDDRPHLREEVGTMARRFPVLWTRRRQLAGTLSGGEQQLLAVARALLARPRYLVLDEPLLGLSPANVGEVLGSVREAASTAGVLVLEQGSRAALAASDRAYFLEGGRVWREGRTGALLQDAAVLGSLLSAGWLPAAAEGRSMR